MTFSQLRNGSIFQFHFSNGLRHSSHTRADWCLVFRKLAKYTVQSRWRPINGRFKLSLIPNPWATNTRWTWRAKYMRHPKEKCTRVTNKIYVDTGNRSINFQPIKAAIRETSVSKYTKLSIYKEHYNTKFVVPKAFIPQKGKTSKKVSHIPSRVPSFTTILTFY